MKKILIPSGSTLATFVYEKSSNLDGYEEMDKLTINEVKKIDGFLGSELFGDGKKNIFISVYNFCKYTYIFKQKLIKIMY